VAAQAAPNRDPVAREVVDLSEPNSEDDDGSLSGDDSYVPESESDDESDFDLEPLLKLSKKRKLSEVLDTYDPEDVPNAKRTKLAKCSGCDEIAETVKSSFYGKHYCRDCIFHDLSKVEDEISEREDALNEFYEERDEFHSLIEAFQFE